MANKTNGPRRQTRARRRRQTPRRSAEHRALALVDMPAEIVDIIMRGLVRPVDICACAQALSMNAGLCLARHTALDVATVLSAGAPLSIVDDFVTARHRRDTARMPFAWLLAAVRGGRPDVVEWMHETNHVSAPVHIDRWAGPHVAAHQLKNACAVKLALRAAIESGHGPVLSWLLARYRPDRHSRSRSALHALVPLVLQAPHHTVYALLAAIHQADPHKGCACPVRLVYAAAESDRTGVLDWMYDHKCAAMMGTSKRSGIDALFLWGLTYGRSTIAQWAWAKIDDPGRIDPKAVGQAATRAMTYGRATTVEFVCRLGVWTLPPSVIDYARRQGIPVPRENVPGSRLQDHRPKRVRHQEPPLPCAAFRPDFKGP